MRSDDLGETWRQLTTRRGEFHADGLSFVSRDDGWLDKDALFETKDGGESWKAIGEKGFAGALLRDNPGHAWASSERNSILETFNGGETWTSRKAPEEKDLHPVRRDAEGRLPAFFNRAASPGRQEEPLLQHDFFAVSDNVVGEISDTWLSWYRSGELVRRAPPLRSMSTQRTPLDGVTASNGFTRLGWAGDVLFRSEDRGLSWFLVGTLPERMQTMRGLRDGAFVAKAKGGLIYRAEYVDGAWIQSRSRLDVYLLSPFSQAAPSEKVNADSRLACLASGGVATVTIDFGQTGYGDPRPEAERFQALRLHRQQGVDVIEGRLYEGKSFKRVGPVRLTPEQGAAVRRGLFVAANEQEREPCRVMDADTFADVRVQCRTGEPETTVSLRASGDQRLCNRPSSPFDSAGGPSYQPAIGIGEFAEEVLVVGAQLGLHD